MNFKEIEKEFEQIFDIVNDRGLVESVDRTNGFPYLIALKDDFDLACFEENYPMNWEILEPVVASPQDIGQRITDSQTQLDVLKWILEVYIHRRLKEQDGNRKS